jgi:iron complex transport system ATP-binding protein
MAETTVTFDKVKWQPQTGNFKFGPVSVTAEAGKFIALVGPNGAGKSTLLNLVSGIISPQDGQLELFGKSHGDWTSRERGRLMAFLSQDPERPFGFPVNEYIGLGRFPHLGPFRNPGERDKSIISDEISAWGLDSLETRSVSNLSGGEFQRVRLARALAQEPKLLLLDEPGNHLDLSSRTSILNRLCQEARSGRCVMAVLHDVNDALLYSDEVWLVADGQLQCSGTPLEVLEPERLARIYDIKLTPFTNEDGLMMLGVPSVSKS